MKIAVTGASGHVGSNLCRILIEEGHQVNVLVHQNTKSIEGLKLEQIKGDITDKEALMSLCKDVEVVFHLAAKISINSKANGRISKTNIEGTRNLIEACKAKNVRRLIHFSTIHAIDHNPYDLPLDETREMVMNSPIRYEETKAQGELLVQEAVKDGLDAVILNPTSIVGPYDFGPSLMGQALLKMYKNTLPVTIPFVVSQCTGNKIGSLVQGGYNFVDVRDVCQAAIQAAERGKSGERYIVSGQYLSLTNLSKTIAEVTGAKTTSFTFPAWLAKMGVPFITIWAKMRNEAPLYTYESLNILKSVNKNISNQKARNELDYQPREIKDTINDTIHWFKENGFV